MIALLEVNVARWSKEQHKFIVMSCLFATRLWDDESIMKDIRAFRAVSMQTSLVGGSCPLASNLVAKRVGDEHDRRTRACML